MKNWKTTLGGFVAAVGIAMQSSSDARVHFAGYIVTAAGVAFFGVSAKDKNVTGGTTQQ